MDAGYRIGRTRPLAQDEYVHRRFCDMSVSFSISMPNEALETLAQRVAAIVLERIEHTPSRRWLTVDSAAEYLDRTPDAIRGLVKRGELTA